MRATGQPSSARVADTADLEGLDDRGLVAAFAAGRRDAFDVIVTRHQRSVYQLCYRFVGNHEDAADLAQDVFVRAFKGLTRFKGDAALGTWLHRVAVNAALNRRAIKRPLTEPIGDVDPVDGASHDPTSAIDAERERRRMRAAIKQLPPKQQAAVILRVYHELSHEEIAATLGSTVGAAKTNFFHALGNLKRLLQS